MSLGFDCCWVFLWWVLPCSWLIEGHSIHRILYSVVQVWTGCVEAGSSVCMRFWGFSLTIVQLFVLGNFSTIWLYFLMILGGGYFGFHSLLHLLPLLSVGGFYLSAGILVFTAPSYSFVIIWRGKGKCINTVGVYSIRFKVPTSREEIGDPLDKYSVNSDISPN